MESQNQNLTSQSVYFKQNQTPIYKHHPEPREPEEMEGNVNEDEEEEEDIEEEEDLDENEQEQSEEDQAAYQQTADNPILVQQ